MSDATGSKTSLTGLLQAWQQGDGQAFSLLFERVYVQLKQIAAQRLRDGGSQVTLTPTELLHEAVLRAVDAPRDYQNRAHFFATMSLMIRATLVDHARARAAQKRGGDAVRVTFTQADCAEESLVVDILALDQALLKLDHLDARSSEVLHLTYFAGFERKQIADVLQISIATVDRELKFARAWLSKELDYALG